MSVHSWLLTILLSFTAVTCAGADFDLIIRNGRVIDGSGNPWFRADVGVRNGKIAVVGALQAPLRTESSTPATGWSHRVSST